MLKRFDLDLKLKVTEPFEGENFKILSPFTIKDKKQKMTSKDNLGKSTLISVALKTVS